jgi:hypothetical protein
MSKKRNATGREWIDPDDALELTDEWFDTADYYEGAVSLCLDDRQGDGEHGERLSQPARGTRPAAGDPDPTVPAVPQALREKARTIGCVMPVRRRM